MADSLPMTERRLQALRWVQQGQVAYNSVQAAYAVADQDARTWDFRTLSELRKAGFIAIGDEIEPGVPLRRVALTEGTEDLLK